MKVQSNSTREYQVVFFKDATMIIRMRTVVQKQNGQTNAFYGNTKNIPSSVRKGHQDHEAGRKPEFRFVLLTPNGIPWWLSAHHLTIAFSVKRLDTKQRWV